MEKVERNRAGIIAAVAVPKIVKKENGDSEDDEEASEVENSPADFEKTYVDPMAKNKKVGEGEDDRPEMENVEQILYTQEKARIKRHENCIPRCIKVAERSTTKRLKNMQIITNKEDMTAEEMEEFWAARSLDPYKSIDENLLILKNSFMQLNWIQQSL